MLTLLCVVVLQAPGDWERVRTQYNAMKYEAALKTLANAITEPGLTKSDRANIYLYTGLCRHQLGDVKGALAAFHEALTLDRAVTLPADVPPKTALAFQSVESSLPALAPIAPPQPPEPPAVMVVPPLPPPLAEPAPMSREPVRRWWPMGVSLGVSLGSLGAALLLGSQATQTFAMAEAEPFASDGWVLARKATGQATAANVLFVAAGVALAFGVVAAVVW